MTAPKRGPGRPKRDDGRPGERDAAAVERAVGRSAPDEPAAPAPTIDDPVSPEEAHAAAKNVQALHEGLAQMIGPEWRLPDSYLPLIGESAARTQRMFLPKETTKPYVLLAAQLGGHWIGAASTTGRRVAKEKRDTAGNSGDRAPAGAGGGAPARPFGVLRRAAGAGPGRERAREEQPDTATDTIGTLQPDADS